MIKQLIVKKTKQKIQILILKYTYSLIKNKSNFYFGECARIEKYFYIMLI